MGSARLVPPINRSRKHEIELVQIREYTAENRVEALNSQCLIPPPPHIRASSTLPHALTYISDDLHPSSALEHPCSITKPFHSPLSLYPWSVTSATPHHTLPHPYTSLFVFRHLTAMQCSPHTFMQFNVPLSFIVTCPHDASHTHTIILILHVSSTAIHMQTQQAPITSWPLPVLVTFLFFLRHVQSLLRDLFMAVTSVSSWRVFGKVLHILRQIFFFFHQRSVVHSNVSNVGFCRDLNINFSLYVCWISARCITTFVKFEFPS